MSEFHNLRRSLDACRKSQRALLDKLKAAETALAAARAAGAAEAFERCAVECERVATEARKNDKEWRDWQWALGRERGAAPKDGTTHYAAVFATAIRALAKEAAK